MNIIDFIPHGADNAISSKDLQLITHCDSRTIRQHIANARLKGAVICSSLEGRAGYFIPDSPDEAVKYVNTERKRIRSSRKALVSAEKYIKGVII